MLYPVGYLHSRRVTHTLSVPTRVSRHNRPPYNKGCSVGKKRYASNNDPSLQRNSCNSNISRVLLIREEMHCVNTTQQSLPVGELFAHVIGSRSSHLRLVQAMTFLAFVTSWFGALFPHQLKRTKRARRQQLPSNINRWLYFDTLARWMAPLDGPSRKWI